MADLDPTVPFTSIDAERAAFQDPRYATSSDFRDAVAAKLALSPERVASGTQRPVSGYHRQVNGGPVETSSRVTWQSTPEDMDKARTVIELREELTRLEQQQQDVSARIEMEELYYLDQPAFLIGSPEEVKLRQTPFKSREDMTRAMSSARYRNRAAYRAHVEARVALSSF